MNKFDLLIDAPASFVNNLCFFFMHEEKAQITDKTMVLWLLEAWHTTKFIPLILFLLLNPLPNQRSFIPNTTYFCLLRWSVNYVSAWSNSSVVVEKAVSNATGIILSGVP